MGIIANVSGYVHINHAIRQTSATSISLPEKPLGFSTYFGIVLDGFFIIHCFCQRKAH